MGLNGVVDMVGLGLSGKAVDDAVCLRGVVMVDTEGLGFRGMVNATGVWLGGIFGEEVDGVGFGDTNIVDIVGLVFRGKDIVDIGVLVGGFRLGFRGNDRVDAVE